MRHSRTDAKLFRASPVAVNTVSAPLFSAKRKIVVSFDQLAGHAFATTIAVKVYFPVRFKVEVAIK